MCGWDWRRAVGNKGLGTIFYVKGMCRGFKDLLNMAHTQIMIYGWEPREGKGMTVWNRKSNQDFLGRVDGNLKETLWLHVRLRFYLRHPLINWLGCCEHLATDPSTWSSANWHILSQVFFKSWCCCCDHGRHLKSSSWCSKTFTDYNTLWPLCYRPHPLTSLCIQISL